MESVEIWRRSYAYKVLRVLDNIVGDVDIHTEHEDESEVDDTNISEWSQIKDDTLLDMLDSQDLENMECYMDFSSTAMLHTDFIPMSVEVEYFPW